MMLAINHATDRLLSLIPIDKEPICGSGQSTAAADTINASRLEKLTARKTNSAGILTVHARRTIARGCVASPNFAIHICELGGAPP